MKKMTKAKGRQTTKITPTDRALVMLNWITVGTVILFTGLLLLAFLA